MLITGKRILDDNLLKKTTEESLRSSSYYLRIHSIIPSGDEAKGFDPKKPKKSHTLEPGALALVISQEIFDISSNRVTALVTLRSGFTKRGLLALDVGLVDYGYEGPIGSVIMNFSKSSVQLNAGDEFFRVIFFEHDEIETPNSKISYNHDRYIKERHSEMVQNFPNSFLRIEERTKEIEDQVFEKVIGKESIKKIQDDILEKAVESLKSRLFWPIIRVSSAAMAITIFLLVVLAFNVLPPLETLRELTEIYLANQAANGGS